MHSFPPAFTAELARRDGAAPVWLLGFTAAAVDYLLCQDAINVTPWGRSALPWISSWGKLNQGVTGTLDDFHISDLSVSLLVDPDAAPNLRTIAKAKHLNSISMSVYLWFDGCADPPQELYRFRVRDINLPDEATVDVDLQDESIRYEEYYPGRVLTLADYPYADPDDVGKIIPLAFGTLEKFRTLSIDAGAITTLVATISATAVTMKVSDASSFYIDMLVTIDEETIQVTGINGTLLTIVRGVDATVAAIHNRGSAIVEVRPNAFVYQVCDHPLQAINKVWAKVGGKMMDISAIATTYTGQVANEHPDLPGKAVVTVPGFITISQAVNLLVNDGIGISDLISILDGTGLSNTLNFSDTIGVSHTFAINDGKILVDGIDVSDTIGISNLLSILDEIDVSDTIAVSDTIDISDHLEVGDNLVVTDELTVGADYSISQGSHQHPTQVGGTSTVSVDNYHSNSGISYATAAYDQNNSTVAKALSNGGNICYQRDAAVSISNPLRIRFGVKCQLGNSAYDYVKIYFKNAYNHTFVIGTGSIGFQTFYSGWIACTAIADLYNSAGTYAYIYWSNSGLEVAEVWWEVEYGTAGTTYTGATGVGLSGSIHKDGTITKTGNAYRSGTLSIIGEAYKSGAATKIGNAALSGSISKAGAASKTGTVSTTGAIGLTGNVSKTGSAALTGEVTKTGTVTRSGAVMKTGTVIVTGNSVANTLIGEAVYVDLVSDISSPPAVVGALLGQPCQIVGQLPPGYSLNGAITVSRRAPEWLHDLSRQCRCWFRFILGTPTLIVRPDALIPVKSISEIRLKNGRLAHSQKLTAMSDVINTINLLYDRDWSKDSNDQNAYRRVHKDKDDGSIDDYGPREKPELFKLDFVTSPAMAASLVTFYLHWYADQRWRHTFEGYIFEAALEFADAVNMAFLDGEVGEVMEARLNPGRGKDISTINLTIIE